MWSASYRSQAHRITLGDLRYRHLRCPETPCRSRWLFYTLLQRAAVPNQLAMTRPTRCQLQSSPGGKLHQESEHMLPCPARQRCWCAPREGAAC